MQWGPVFSESLEYHEFLATHGTPDHASRWQRMYDRVVLKEQQLELLGSFTREMRVLCMAGTWCGDCVEQCPILLRFAEANSVIGLRFIDRDASEEVKSNLALCGGARVPQVVFLNEDDQFVGHFGDRTLAKYRQMVADQIGNVCPTGLVGPPDELLAATVAGWLDEFERIQWMLRTSPRLREKHGD